MRTYHIFTATPGIISVNGVNCGMEFVNIECEDADSFSVSIMPTDGSMPYAFMISESLNLPPNVRIYTLPRNHYDIIAQNVKHNGVLHRKSILFNNERICPTVLNNGELWFDTLMLKLPSPTPEPEYDPVTISNNEFLEISAPGFLALIDKNYNLIGSVSADKITRRGNVIETQSSFSDLAGRAHIEKYAVGKTTMSLLENYNIYLDGSPRRPTDHNLYPLAFLQSVICRDFDEARHYLSDDLNESLSDKDLEEFFPFKDIYPCSYYPDNCVVLIDEKNKGKLFKITYTEDCIENIEELE